MHIQRGLVGPHFKEHEQARVLLVAQHVVLDAARLLAAGLDEGAEQGFERISHFRAGLGFEDKRELLTHGALLGDGW